MKKRALVLGSGGLRGAYSAGVLATLCRSLGPDYFHAVHASSVGVFAATFFVANQPDTIEKTWRTLVDGKRLVNMYNLFRSKKILDLGYLSHIFQSDASHLNVQKVINSPIQLTYTLTEYPTGKAVYCQPDYKNIFDLMRASAALPHASSPVNINGTQYIDGGLAEPLPISKALHDDYDQIIVVHNKPLHLKQIKTWFDVVSNSMAMFLPSKISALQRSYNKRLQVLIAEIQNNPKITIISPHKPLPLKSLLDTNKERLNESIDMGIEDARIFINRLAE